MPRVALYVRASTEHQKYSTENQIVALRAHALEHLFEVTAVYEDDGRSGLDLAGRPALRQLLQDILAEATPFEVVLVYDVSRWGRFQDADEGAFYEHLCKRAGISLVYVAEPFLNEDTPVSSVMKAIKRAMAAEYSRELSRKVLTGQIRMVERGFMMGGTPCLGFRRLLVDQNGEPRTVLARGETKSIATDRVVLALGPDDEIALVNRIFRLVADEGLTQGRVANRLNAEGILSPRGGKWWGAGVAMLIRCERYVGNYTFNKTSSRLRQKRRTNAKDLWVRRVGAVQAIVDRRLFDRANYVLDNIRPKYTHQEAIEALRRLYAAKGRITGRLVDLEPGMPTAIFYRRHFGSLSAAARMVGFTTPVYPNLSKFNAARAYNREGMLEKLADLHQRKGFLNRAVINAEPDMPSAASYARYFGTLTQAYQLIGLVGAIPPGPKQKMYDLNVPMELSPNRSKAAFS